MKSNHYFAYRLLFLLTIAICACGVAVRALYQLQVVQGASYVGSALRTVTTSQSLQAARGEILDADGTVLIGNTLQYNLSLEFAYWQTEMQDDTLLQLQNFLDSYNITPLVSFPISFTIPYEYTVTADDADYQNLLDFVANLGYSTHSATAVMDALCDYYALSPDIYTDAQLRTLVGWHYAMDAANFSIYNDFLCATDVPIALVAALCEQGLPFAGIAVALDSTRTYYTDFAAHILGRTGQIYAEDWAEYESLGYNMNEIVGISGMEQTLESYLRGQNGESIIEIDIAGNVSPSPDSTDPQAGYSCFLTLDLDLQQVCEQSLASHLTQIEGSAGGAVVVLEVNTGRVLAMASYPTYNLASFSADYENLLTQADSPLFNRAISGTYAPGSCYKMITAIAALEEGVLTADETYTCTHEYTRYSDHTFTCLGTHGALNVTGALQKSCNVFFYEMGYRLGGQTLEDWAYTFGFGAPTGIALAGEASGTVAGPQSRAQLQQSNSALEDWQAGDVLQAAIGQSDNAFSPLQMACYMATLVNGGTQYQPYLLEKVTTFDQSSVIYTAQPTVLNTLAVSTQTLDLVKQGLGAVVSEGGTAAQIFADYPIALGGKSGTAQTGSSDTADNGVFLAFAPFDQPEIAICVVGEQAGSGSAVAPIVRDILDAYFQLGTSAN